MTKEEVKSILADLLASGEFNLSVDETEVFALIDQRQQPVLARLLAVETALKPAAPGRLDALAAAKPKVKVKLGKRPKADAERRAERRDA